MQLQAVERGACELYRLHVLCFPFYLLSIWSINQCMLKMFLVLTFIICFPFQDRNLKKNSGPLFEVHRPAAGFGALPVLAETQTKLSTVQQRRVGLWVARYRKDRQGQADNSSTIGSIGPRGFEKHNIQSTA